MRAAGDVFVTIPVYFPHAFVLCMFALRLLALRQSMTSNLKRAADRKEADRLFKEARERARAQYGYGSGPR